MPAGYFDAEKRGKGGRGSLEALRYGCFDIAMTSASLTFLW